MNPPIAYVLLSGGIDSTAAMARAIYRHGVVRAVSVDYGQRHRREIQSAAAVAHYYDAPHEVLRLPMPRTMLTDPSVEVPKVSYSEIVGVSPTYVPFRNGYMLAALTSLVAGRHLDPLAEDQRDVVLLAGMHAEDAAGGAYPDCTKDFTDATGQAIAIGTYGRIRLEVPFIEKLKADIIREGHGLGAPFHLTFSCYEGGEVHCGTCATCRARREAFQIAGVPDPTEYAAEPAAA